MLTPAPKALILDLEVIPGLHGESERIIKIGALRVDTGQTFEQKVDAKSLQEALLALDLLVDGASFVMGHNIIAHDLPILQRIAPALALLNLPAIDTLLLSPLAFPQNPYHRLIKDYKLIRDSMSSPLADCRATLTLFNDQREAFDHLYASTKDELRIYHGLIASQAGAGLGNYMLALTHQKAPALAELKCMIPDLLRETDPTQNRDLKVCRPRLEHLLKEDLINPAMHWPIAYCLAWLRVSGGISVLAPWVRYQFPAVAKLITELRDQACNDPACQYCLTTHNPKLELKRYFGFDDFRPEPKNQQTGGSLQFDIVSAGMRGQNVLAVLPTGGGKSLCYQLPALNRFHRNGGLTIIISPLQSLMKDQIDGLRAKNVQTAAMLNGMLTMPERADILEKIQMGDLGILLVSPEQFRNKAFKSAIEHRQINAWIFDEAHCLSKWGNDFRTDYLYAARFIRELTGTHPLAPIGCFTATAKLDVLDDIRDHFKRELNLEFVSFMGGHERTNLDFEVMPISKAEKWQRTHQLLAAEFAVAEGGAVVFVASRKSAEELAEFLKQQSWKCEHFHAGLSPQIKKDIQDEFIRGDLRIIVATNAFGMGVDKQDIRLVIHAEIPGSLENYLQEAGRAGRDQAQARCVLLYDPSDIETQFGMSERSKLTKSDIEQILKKLRHAAKRRPNGPITITAGEILSDQYVNTSFEADDRGADTKVATAISWLERAEFLLRNENNTQVFPAKLKYTTLEEALKSLQSLQSLQKTELSVRRQQEYTSILSMLYEARADEKVSTDQLMLHTGLSQEEVTAILRSLAILGLLINDTQVTLYLHSGVVGASLSRLADSQVLEKALFAELREWATDADQGEWQDINLPALTTKLRDATALVSLLPLHLTRLLRTLSQDSDDEGRVRGSFELKQLSHERLKVRIKGSQRTWADIEQIAEKRRVIGQQLLQFLLAKLPTGKRGKDLLIETSLGELIGVLESDLELACMTRPEKRSQHVQDVLLYLHTEEVLVLNHGMTVMRRAMTIQINAEVVRRYQKDDFLPLEEHYAEKRIQVHVMREYAEIALGKMTDALRLVMDYFTLSKGDFLKQYFSHKKDVLALATSESSYLKIIDPLSVAQRQIVTADEDVNCLVLAGPGSGKTRVIVHRVAFLLRVKRIPASSIIVLTFNRHAANEIRKRMFELVGNDAFGLTILTYHAMAMRLMGVSFGGRSDVAENEMSTVLENAVQLLEGKLAAEGDDELRDQLLGGYRFILVDEYQDIDNWQYRLVSALAGRSSEQEGKLSILVVGDDDQNVYSWRDTSNVYIEQFCLDYQAKQEFLVENYRSSRHIIAAANALINENPQRLKREWPIRVDDERKGDALGGRWQALDGERAGKVLRLRISRQDHREGNLQCQVVLAELKRLLALDPLGSWSDCTILARTHRYLWTFQAWCEQHGVPYLLAADQTQQIPLTRQRDFVRAIEALRSEQELNCNAAMSLILAQCTESDWQDYFAEAGQQLRAEFGDCLLSGALLIDWFYDYARETRKSRSSGIYLGTVHSAKGLEFKHVVVLDGGWNTVTEDERRLYYVAMTRAKETLTLTEFAEDNPLLFTKQLDRPSSLMRESRGYVRDEQLTRRYQSLTLKDVDLGFAGRKTSSDAIHARLAALKSGDRLVLKLRPDGRYDLLDQFEQVLGRTAKKFVLTTSVDYVEVNAILLMDKYAQKEEYQASSRVEQWAVVIPRIVSGVGASVI